LLLTALEMMVTHPQLQEHLQAINNVSSNVWDQVEDALDCEQEVPGNKDAEPEGAFGCHLFRWVSFSGAGLVIEAQTNETSFFVIGVSPSPANLALPNN